MKSRAVLVVLVVLLVLLCGSAVIAGEPLPFDREHNSLLAIGMRLAELDSDLAKVVLVLADERNELETDRGEYVGRDIDSAGIQLDLVTSCLSFYSLVSEPRRLALANVSLDFVIKHSVPKLRSSRESLVRWMAKTGRPAIAMSAQSAIRDIDAALVVLESMNGMLSKAISRETSKPKR